MTRIVPALMALTLLGSACSRDGVWAFYFHPDEGYECVTTVTHNYRDAMLPEGTTTTEWTYTEELTATPAVAFGEVFGVGSDHAKLLVMQGDVFHGNREAGELVFTWAGSEDVRETASHISGFFGSYHAIMEEVEELSLDFQGGHAEGVGTYTVTSLEEYEESDSWDPSATGHSSSEIPADHYLVSTNDSWVENTPNSDDCTDTRCLLTVEQTCSATARIEAATTSLNHTAYEGTRNAGRPYGISN